MNMLKPIINYLIINILCMHNILILSLCFLKSLREMLILHEGFTFLVDFYKNNGNLFK